MLKHFLKDLRISLKTASIAASFFAVATVLISVIVVLGPHLNIAIPLAIAIPIALILIFSAGVLLGASTNVIDETH